MKKSTLRVMGLGFLASALIVAGFETFIRGNAPVEGITVQSIFDNNKTQLKEQESQIKQVESERDSLSSDMNEAKKTIASFQKKESEQESKIQSLEKNNASLLTEYVGNNQEDEDETTVTENNDSSTQENSGGVFTVGDGESSSEIAQRLEQEGLIDSATEFQALIDQWQLNEYIQSNDYELKPSMSMDEILSIITNGAYYY